jgi:hypothetical protein
MYDLSGDSAKGLALAEKHQSGDRSKINVLLISNTIIPL